MSTKRRDRSQGSFYRRGWGGYLAYIYGSASTIWTKWVDSFLGYLKTRQLLSSWLKSLRQQCVNELWIRALSTPSSPHVELWYYTFHHEWIQMWRRCSSNRVMEKVININGQVYQCWPFCSWNINDNFT